MAKHGFPENEWKYVDEKSLPRRLRRDVIFGGSCITGQSEPCLSCSG